MGIIRKQSIWGTIITYLGAILGFITTGVLFPRVFSTEQVGLISIIVAYATVLSTFASLGVHQIIGRFFPYFKDKKKGHNGFVFLITVIPLVGFLIISFIFPIIQNYFIKKSGESYLLNDYIIYIIPLIFMILFFNVYETYYKFLYNITLGAFLKEILQRIIILIGVLFFYFTLISFSNFINIYVVAFAVPLIVIIAFLIKQKEFIVKPQLNFLSQKLKNSIISMGFFGIISSFAGIIIVNVDKIMLERLMGLDDVGVYTIAFFFGMLIILPSRPLIKISSAYIAEAWKNKDIELIKTIYIKSSITQFIVGLLLLIGIWSNIHNIFKILPEEYNQGKFVILLIGFAYLTDMITGTSSYILINSKHYKYVTYIVLVLIVISFATNLVFIPIWGLIGAAFASLISKIIANALFVVSLKLKYNLFPFSYRHALIAIIGIIVYGINYILPISSNYIFDIAYRSSIISVVFIALVYFTKVSEDINETIKKIVKIAFKL